MKILHTGDWHLGKRLQEFNRIDEQQMVMQEIIKIADREQVNAVLVAGDLFDTYNPVTEAIELFYQTLFRLSDYGRRAVVAIAGNHDSAERIEAPHPLAANCGIILYGHPDTEIAPFELDSGLKVIRTAPGFIELALPGINDPLRLLLTPYANEITFKKFLGKDHPQDQLRKLLTQQWKSLSDKYCDDHGVNLMMAHLYFASKSVPGPEESDDEKSILFQGGAQAIFTEDLPETIQYAALGHLHRRQEIPAPIPVVYCGSPLSYSFSEADQKKSVEIIELVPGQPAIQKTVNIRKGRKLTRQRFEDLEGAVAWLTDHPDTFVELTLVTDNYLGAKDKQRLHKVHQGIVSIIPELATTDQPQRIQDSIDLSQDLKSLFVEYFKYKKGQHPNPALLDILDEIIHN